MTSSCNNNDRRRDGVHQSYSGATPIHFPADTLRNNDVVITSKRCHFDVMTSKRRRFHVITTLLLRHVFSGFLPGASFRLLCSLPPYLILQKLRIKFTSMKLEYDYGCNDDYVAVYDYHSEKLIAKFCGGSCVGRVTLPSNRAKVVFHTNSSGLARGFKLRYWRVPRCK